jgi:hypothetical protein
MTTVENRLDLQGSRASTPTFFKALGAFPQLWIIRGSQGVVLFHEVPPPFPFPAGGSPCPDWWITGGKRDALPSDHPEIDS